MNWQPIEDCHENGDVLVIDMKANTPRADIAHFRDGFWVACSEDTYCTFLDHEVSIGDIGVYYPTHWMPIPNPPAKPSPSSLKFLDTGRDE